MQPIAETVMGRAERLRRVYEANIACGDVGESEASRMLAEIAAAEVADQESDLQPDAA